MGTTGRRGQSARGQHRHRYLGSREVTPDGYTLVSLGNTLATNHTLVKTPYDALKDIAPIEPYYNNAEQTAALLRSDIAKYAKIIKDANIKME